MERSKPRSVDRRTFLKDAAVAGSVGIISSGKQAQAQTPRPKKAPVAPMSREAETTTPPALEVLTNERPSCDFMVDVIKSLGFEYVCANPGSSFRGLHESLINYGGNHNPELITCCHEESSVAMAHGYAKIEGKPLAVFAHGTVGVQHASMAIFNAYCDRVPVYIILGNTLDATKRRPGAEWDHSVQDAAAMVRDYIKWDDLPLSLPHFAESAVRAYKIAMTPPMLPVVLVVDSELQENAIPEGAALEIPKLNLPRPPQADTGAVAEIARLLVNAENPLLIADRAARTPAGMRKLVELAELLQAPVVDQAGRMNFPSRHPLNHTFRKATVLAQADVIVGLELADFWGAINSLRDQQHRTSRRIAQKEARLVSIGTGGLYMKSNYQDQQRFYAADIEIAADAETTLPVLVEAIKRLLNDDTKRRFENRGMKLAKAREEALQEAREQAAYGWDVSPVSVARLCAELWAQIKDEDWSLVSYLGHLDFWPLRLWSFEKHYHHIGGPGGYGIGYTAPASLGAALANKKHGRLTVNIQDDGDLLYGPGILWTSAHHHIPLLSVMHNNRAYHQELMHVQRMANRHNRGVDRAGIGTSIEDPAVDFAKVAQGMGVYAEGPITEPGSLGPAIRRAIAVVKRGEPALLDVVTQPR